MTKHSRDARWKVERLREILGELDVLMGEGRRQRVSALLDGLHSDIDGLEKSAEFKVRMSRPRLWRRR